MMCLIKIILFVIFLLFDFLKKIVGNKRFSRVAIGSDNSKIIIHPNFKFVLICNSSEVHLMVLFINDSLEF